jgi:diaminohydroxyphosphoribosylaminopyrimidine deaminase / 5-amino-6-(5-phosphoribosylamino)uracil reductase
MSGTEPKRPTGSPPSAAPPANSPTAPPPSPRPESPRPQTDDERWMEVALTHAKAGKPSPNPHVGAVVVKDGEVVGSAHHERAGTDHAETAALRAAGEKAEGASLYVTLEPCNHHGRTPPCTDVILASKVARVVIGVRDPNPHVEGGGVEKLRAAGVEVVVGVCEDKARAWIAPWSKHITTSLPYVSLKLALSLDGRIATRTGESRWVTGPDARAKVHLLRAKSDGIAIGIGTALADDPRLTVRDAPGDSPLRIVFDTKLRLPLASRLVQTARETPTLVLCGHDAPAENEEQLTAVGVECLRSPLSAEGRLDVLAALRSLAQRGIVSLMVEGGAELAGSFLAGRFADELHVFVAPLLLGPRGRAGAVDWAGPDTPQKAPRIAIPAWELVGNDAYVHGPLVYPD